MIEIQKVYRLIEEHVPTNFMYLCDVPDCFRKYLKILSFGGNVSPAWENICTMLMTENFYGWSRHC